MKSLKYLVLLLSILLVREHSLAQFASKEDKLNFAEKITKVKFWTCIEKDSSYVFYIEAMNAIKNVLNRKGYETEQLFYYPSSGIPVDRWRKMTIGNLPANEAYLEVTTKIQFTAEAKTAGSNRNVAAISDASGIVIYSHNAPVDGSVGAYASSAHAQLFLHSRPDSTSTQSMIFSHVKEITSSDIFEAVSRSLEAIPRSKNPVQFSGTAGYNKSGSVAVEISAFGGYALASSMSVSVPRQEYFSSVLFAPNAILGFDLAFGISRSFDILMRYQREDTRFHLNELRFVDHTDFDVSMNYFLVGSNYNLRINSMFSPYIGLCVGGVTVVPKDNNYRDAWYLAMTGCVGLKVYLSNHFGLRFQTEVIGQLHPQGAPFLYTLNSYVTPINASSNMFQMNFSGGVVFRFGK